ncbi:Serine hydrolase-like protein [Melipona quadrifasciata]|uniref:Serine hydrolase-like protein n=1 Tax=Melipona quadrifasciata TaxID=166423 RepID=A0A0M9A4L8_9HYME|nr:Serine hydrolase-like protein [Melipona quadrifasciata]
MSRKRISTEVKFPVPWGYIAGKIYGFSEKKKILMVHGISDNAGVFDRLMEYLPEEYQYVNIDLPGHGFSSPMSAGLPLHFFDYVYSILLVLTALKWQTCTYIGHSLGAHIGTYFSILYPGRLEKIVAIDGLVPFFISDTINFIRELYSNNINVKHSERLYTKEQMIYSLQFRRYETLNKEAAEALFKRAVTKVGDLYKYNRDKRLGLILKPYFTIDQHRDFFSKYSTKTLLIVADNSSRAFMMSKIIEALPSVININDLFTVISVRGNHDVHNNYPERIAPHICKFLHDNLQSKL